MKEYIEMTLENLRSLLPAGKTLTWLLDNEDDEHWTDLAILIREQLGFRGSEEVYYNCGRLEGVAASSNHTILEMLDNWGVSLDE